MNPLITHSSFSNDLIMFAPAYLQSMQAIKGILNSFTCIWQCCRHLWQPTPTDCKIKFSPSSSSNTCICCEMQNDLRDLDNSAITANTAGVDGNAGG